MPQPQGNGIIARRTGNLGGQILFVKTYLYIIQIILSIAVMALVLLQAKGSGLSGVFGGDGGVYKTRRGIERTLFNVTIGVSIAFFTISVISVLVNR